MGDALSSSVSFTYLKSEIIDTVNSPVGKRHLWLWLSKRPNQMASFAQWLQTEHGISWPPHLVAMTTITNNNTRQRIDQLKRVPSLLKGLSVEPLIENIDLDLEDIDWVIVGGESGSNARGFDLTWARNIQAQCQRAGSSYFLKQLGTNPEEDGFPITLRDRHGGDWSEWPEDLRVREFPEKFQKSHTVNSTPPSRTEITLTAHRTS